MASANGNGYSQPANEYKPRLIFWEVTKGCNLRCIHCRASATELSSPTDLATDRALGIIDQIAGFALVVKQEREPLQMAEQVARERPGHVLPQRQRRVARDHRRERARERDC